MPHIQSSRGLLAVLVLILFSSCEEPVTDDGYVHTIAFAADEDGYDDPDIRIMRENGADLRRIEWTDSQEQLPHFHPTAPLVYFVSDRDGEGFNLYQADSTATTINQLTTSMNIDNYAFSANGDWITFEHVTEDNDPKVMRMRSDGSDLQELTDGMAPMYNTSSKIWFTAPEYPRNLMVYNLGDGNTEQVTSYNNTTYVIDHNLVRDLYVLQLVLPAGTSSWQMVNENGDPIITLDIPSEAYGLSHLSDDGDLLCWVQYTGEGMQVYTADKNIKGITTLTTSSLFKTNADFYHEDLRIMYRAEDTEGDLYYLYKVAAEGGDEIQVSEGYKTMSEYYAIAPVFW